MERKKTKVSLPSSAEYDAGSCERAGDASQMEEEEEFNEDRNDLKIQGSPILISEKEINADEKFSEEEVQFKILGQHEGSSAAKIQPFPILSSPHQSIDSASSSKTEAELGEKRDQALHTTVHLDKDIQCDPELHDPLNDLNFSSMFQPPQSKYFNVQLCSSSTRKKKKKKKKKSFPVESQSEPGGDHNFIEQMLPHVPAEHDSSESPLSYYLIKYPYSDSDIKQSVDLSTKSKKGSNFLPNTAHSMRNSFTGANSSPDITLKQISVELGSDSPNIPVYTYYYDYVGAALKCWSDIDFNLHLPDRHPIQTGRDFGTDPKPECYSSLSRNHKTGQPPRRPDRQSSLINEPWKRKSRGMIFRRQKINKTSPFSIPFTTDDPHSLFSTTDSSDYKLGRPPPGSLTEKEIIKNEAASTPGVSQDNTREMELHATPGPSTLQYLTNPSVHVLGQTKFCPNRKETDDGGPSFTNSCSTVSIPTYSQSIAPNVAAPPCPQVRPAVLQASTVCTERSRTQDAFQFSPLHSESQPIVVSDAPMEIEAPVTAVNYSVTNTLPAHSLLQIFSSDPGWSRRDSSCLPRSPSMPSLSQITSEKNKTLTRVESLPEILLKTSFEEFTPDITADESDETYRFQCSCPGLYQCSVTGLVFHMEGEGDVVYRIVPWNRRLLAQHHKKPAGPLFDIQCPQQSVCQLHLPHCEIRSTGGCDFLSVAHVNDEGIEFISPHRITETHVFTNITGFYGFGNVKDEDSPPDLVRALVLLFYRPPADPDLRSILNVLLLPRNIVLRDVLGIRKELFADENYIETSSHCKLHPYQEYTLSTCPEDDSVLVQPTEAEFDCDNCDNFLPSFQVRLKTILTDINLFLRDTNSSNSVWEREVSLSTTRVRRSCRPSAVSSNDRLFAMRSSFIDGISGPVLKSLLDKLLEKKVMADSERESADSMKNTRDKARFVVDTVRKKGEAASSEMIEFLCDADPFLCKHLGLI